MEYPFVYVLGLHNILLSMHYATKEAYKNRASIYICMW